MFLSQQMRPKDCPGVGTAKNTGCDEDIVNQRDWWVTTCAQRIVLRADGQISEHSTIKTERKHTCAQARRETTTTPTTNAPNEQSKHWWTQQQRDGYWLDFRQKAGAYLHFRRTHTLHCAEKRGLSRHRQKNRSLARSLNLMIFTSSLIHPLTLLKCPTGDHTLSRV